MKLLIIPGSLRKDSYNKKMGKIAEKLAQEIGFQTEFLDLLDYPLPILNQDDTDRFDFSENALAIKKKIKNSDALLFVSGEHNASIPAALKNMIDWSSRASSKEDGPGSVFSGKVAALMSASPSPFGGIRALYHLRNILHILQVLVIPQEKVIPQAHEAFKEQLSEQHQQSIKKCLEALFKVTKKLSV